MIERTVDWSLDNRLLVITLWLVLVAVGVYSVLLIERRAGLRGRGL